MKRRTPRRLSLRGCAAARQLAQRRGRSRGARGGCLRSGTTLRWRRTAIGARRAPSMQVVRPLHICVAPLHLHFGFALVAAPLAALTRVLRHASMERTSVTRELETRSRATRLVFAHEARAGGASRAARTPIAAGRVPAPIRRRAQPMPPSLAGRFERTTSPAQGRTRAVGPRVAGSVTPFAPVRRGVADLHAPPAMGLRLRRTAGPPAGTESARPPAPIPRPIISPQLVWRKAVEPGERGPAPADEGSRGLPGFGRSAPSTRSAHSADAPAASPRTPGAPLDSAMVDCLADDVMRRMERRIRIERERRGI